MAILGCGMQIPERYVIIVCALNGPSAEMRIFYNINHRRLHRKVRNSSVAINKN